mgnify:CR=1 FL=1
MLRSRPFVRPALFMAAFALAVLAACTKAPEPTPQVAQDDPKKQSTEQPDTQRPDATTLEPSLRPWESQDGMPPMSPSDEVMVLERRMEDRVNSDPSANSRVGLGGGHGGGYSGGDTGGSAGASGSPRAGRAPAPETAKRKAESDDKSTGGQNRNAGGVDPSLSATEGSLFAKRGGDTVGQFPLRHTDVRAEVSGYIAATTVTQSFTNPFTEVIEAVYTFPLPGDSAINDFLMVIGERRIRGVVRPRAEAEQVYAEAKARGYTASLLTQERPNIFTQSVANIEVSGEIDIKITYFQTLRYEEGQYEYYFPMVVGPRYIPAPKTGTPTVGTDTGGNSGSGSSNPGTGTAPDNPRVPDASKITPPALPEGMRSGHDISILLDIDAGLTIDHARLESLAHKVSIEKVDAERMTVKLVDADNILNRDFVFRWGIANDKPVGGVVAHRGDSGGFFTLMLQPQLDPADKDVTPREITFIVDVSGSMRGVPMDTSRAVINRCLDTLRPDDLFNIVYFASGNGQVFDKPMPNTPENIEKAKGFLTGMKASGGTEMLKGLQRALAAEHDPAYLQMYAFFTDGYIGNEAEIHRTIKEERNGARFFAFGIGGSVNRHLIDGIAEHGDGKTHYCFPRDSKVEEGAALAFYRMIDSPVLCDISIDYNGLPITDVLPGKVTDLFAGQPIQLVGRYTAAAKGTIFINGRVGARRITIPVEVDMPEVEERNACIAAIWARKRIDQLEGEALTKPADKEIEQQITDLAVEFRLMSRFTSFVAVDESRIVGNGQPLKIVQPVEMPEGVSREGIFGNVVGQPVRIPGWGIVVAENGEGGVGIAQVEKGSAAEKAGVTAGLLIASVNGVAIIGIQHLEGQLLQAAGEVKVGLLQPGATTSNISEVMLPQP